MKSLSGKICLVTGATRGIGKGVALQLGEAGATVYITGRTLKPKNDKVGGSLQETKDEVEKRGGKCIPVVCDHENAEDIKELFKKIDTEQDGRLDILVNNAFSAARVSFDNMDKKFWETDPDLWDKVNTVGLRNHYICSVYAARMMVERKSGIILMISSIGGITPLFNIPYSAGKMAVDRIVKDGAEELRKYNIPFISLYPGAVKTELCSKVIEEEPENEKYFLKYESTEFTGKCIVSLANDPDIMKKSGRVLFIPDLGDEYNLRDIDGSHILSQRCLVYLMIFSGAPQWLINITPEFIKFPKWLLSLTTNLVVSRTANYKQTKTFDLFQCRNIDKEIDLI